MGNVAANYLALLAEIKAQVVSVTDSGPVHDHRRNVTDWDEYFKAFQMQDSLGRPWAVRGWTIRRGTVPSQRDVFPQSWTRMMRFHIEGYHSIVDDPDKKVLVSETIFTQLVDDVCDKLALWATSQTAQTKLYASAPEVAVFDEQPLGSYVVHHCEIVQDVTVRLTTDGSTWTVMG